MRGEEAEEEGEVRGEETGEGERGVGEGLGEKQDLTERTSSAEEKRIPAGPFLVPGNNTNSHELELPITLILLLLLLPLLLLLLLLLMLLEAAPEEDFFPSMYLRSSSKRTGKPMPKPTAASSICC